MTVSRRDLALLLPALSGALTAAQQTKGPKTSEAGLPVLGSKTYEFDELPERSSANGTTKNRPVFNGVTARGQHITMHISELAPGEAPHPPARQPHEEVIVIREGTLEVTLNGQTSRLGPGSVIFSAFNDLNGWKNVGTTPVQYYVLSLEEHSA
jgi:quercetin dioxygenase-like cupin family protein